MQVRENLNEVYFKDVSAGQVFRYEKNFYMSIPEAREHGDLVNCIHLEEGTLFYIYPTETVEPIDGYFQVTGC